MLGSALGPFPCGNGYFVEGNTIQSNGRYGLEIGSNTNCDSQYGYIPNIWTVVYGGNYWSNNTLGDVINDSGTW